MKQLAKVWLGLSLACVVAVWGARLAVGGELNPNLIYNGDFEVDGVPSNPNFEYSYNHEADFKASGWTVGPDVGPGGDKESVAIVNAQRKTYISNCPPESERAANGAITICLRKTWSWIRSTVQAEYAGHYCLTYTTMMGGGINNPDPCPSGKGYIVVDVVSNGVTTEVQRVSIDTNSLSREHFVDQGVVFELEAGTHDIVIRQEADEGAGNIYMLYDNFCLKHAEIGLLQTSAGVDYMANDLPCYGYGIIKPTVTASYYAPAEEIAVSDNLSVKCVGWKIYELTNDDVRGNLLLADTGSVCQVSAEQLMVHAGHATISSAELEWQWKFVSHGSKFHCELRLAGCSNQTESLTNLPVLVRISPIRISGFAYRQLKSRDDLSFVDDWGRVLPYEIDTWDESGESLVWVRANEVTTKGRGRIIMRWRHQQPVANNPQEVWTDYTSVWHLDDESEGSSHSQSDSSACGMTAILDIENYPKAESRIVAGRIGGAIDRYDTAAGAPDRNHLQLKTAANYQTLTELTNGCYTVSGWVYYPEIAAYPNQWKDIFHFGNAWKLIFVDHSTTELQTPFDTHVLTDAENPANGWMYWTLVYQDYGTGATACEFYLNGEMIQHRYEGFKLNSSTAAVEISPYIGQVDETRICRRPQRSAYFVKTEYDMVVNDGTGGKPDFIEYGAAVEQASGLLIVIR